MKKHWLNFLFLPDATIKKMAAKLDSASERIELQQAGLDEAKRMLAEQEVLIEKRVLQLYTPELIRKAKVACANQQVDGKQPSIINPGIKPLH